MESASDNSLLASVTPVVGDAVGVSDFHWFVAIVNHNTEKAAAERLTRMGYDTYVATQEEYRVWRNGRRSRIERVVIPSTVFIRCTEQERRHIVMLPFINRFMTNRAAASSPTSHRPLAIVPPSQISLLRFMLGNSDVPVTITSDHYRAGDPVRIIRGPLRGLCGQVIADTDGSSQLIVRLDFFGCARLAIDPVNVEPAG